MNAQGWCQGRNERGVSSEYANVAKESGIVHRELRDSWRGSEVAVYAIDAFLG